MNEYISELLNLAGSAVVLLVAIVVITRIVGLRSFTKMSGFDFALTVATGSIVASALLSPDMPVLRGVAGLVMIFAVQWTAARLRSSFEPVRKVIDNTPLLLMKGPHILEENLLAARMTRSDLIAKLREANVLHTGQVRAVVLETTGDVSVLHGDADGPALDWDMMLDGVRR